MSYLCYVVLDYKFPKATAMRFAELDFKRCKLCWPPERRRLLWMVASDDGTKVLKAFLEFLHVEVIGLVNQWERLLRRYWQTFYCTGWCQIQCRSTRTHNRPRDFAGAWLAFSAAIRGCAVIAYAPTGPNLFICGKWALKSSKFSKSLTFDKNNLTSSIKQIRIRLSPMG